MNHAAASGEMPTAFGWWAQIWIPSMSMVTSILLAVAVIFIQRNIDRRSNETKYRQSILTELMRWAETFHSLKDDLTNVRPRFIYGRHMIRSAMSLFPKKHPALDILAVYSVWGDILTMELADSSILEDEGYNFRSTETTLDVDGTIVEIDRWRASLLNSVSYVCNSDITNDWKGAASVTKKANEAFDRYR